MRLIYDFLNEIFLQGVCQAPTSLLGGFVLSTWDASLSSDFVLNDPVTAHLGQRWL